VRTCRCDPSCSGCSFALGKCWCCEEPAPFFSLSWSNVDFCCGWRSSAVCSCARHEQVAAVEECKGQDEVAVETVRPRVDRYLHGALLRGARGHLHCLGYGLGRVRCESWFLVWCRHAHTEASKKDASRAVSWQVYVISDVPHLPRVVHITRRYNPSKATGLAIDECVSP